jgi:SAM-dependent methyltransferase
MKISLESVKSVLDMPAAFEVLQSLVGAPRCQRIFIEQYVRPEHGEKILDLGCGTGAAVPYIPTDVEYVGVDISGDYIARARAKHDRSREFIVADVTTWPEPGELFDRAFSFGVLHHISDLGVHKVLEGVGKLVKRGGIYATIDPCIVPGQNWIARFLAKNDRGKHVRTVEEMRGLFDNYGKIEIVVAADMLNMPFDFVICVLTV